MSIRHFVLFAAFTFTLSVFVSDSKAQDGFIGTASGFVVAPEFATADEILAGAGETLTQVHTDNMPNVVASASDRARATTEHGTNRSFARGNADVMAYSGSYWTEELTFTGGTGKLRVDFNWGLSGAISDSAGDYVLGGVPPTGGAAVGTSAVRWRFFSPFDTKPGNPITDPNFFLDQTTDGFGDQFEAPLNAASSFDFVDSFYYVRGFDPEFGVEQVSGALNTGNRDELSGISDNRFLPNWEYDKPLHVGFLLETWSKDGAIVDFTNTGFLESITVPSGTTVLTASGASYNVLNPAIDGDCNGDGVVDASDLDCICDSDFSEVLEELNSVIGDIDLDGTVGFSDFLVLSANFGTVGGYAQGDLDCNGDVAFSDFLILSSDFGNSAPTPAQNVPEPTGILSLVIAATLGCFRRRSR